MKDGYGRALQCPKCDDYYLHQDPATSIVTCKNCGYHGNPQDFRAIPVVNIERLREGWNPSER